MSTEPQENNETFWEKSLRLMKQCPVCEQEYLLESLQVIEQNQESKLIHMTCPHCAHAMLAVVLFTRLGMSSIGVLTDLTALDVKKFSQKQPVSENDILNFHNLLETQKQHMSHLF